MTVIDKFFIGKAVKNRQKDEEVWRTSENGHHYKIETETGEIKAGMGGKINGEKVISSKNVGGLSKAKPSVTAGYTDSTNATMINSALRYGDEDELRPFRAIVDRLDANMQETTQEMTVRREIYSHNIPRVFDIQPKDNSFEALKEAAVGHTFKDAGYMSTYYEKTEANYGDVTMVIDCKPGTEAILTSNDREKEIILGRGQSWNITDVQKNNNRLIFFVTNSISNSKAQGGKQ